MDIWTQLINNKLLMTAILCWLVAQAAKTVLYSVMNRKFDVRRLWGSGGMPSSHAATVCSLATGTLLEYGAGTFAFAFAAIFAIVVLYDARGVRLETGKQAEVLNSIIDGLENEHKLIIPKLELKELVGHTPFQVFIGSLLGIILTLFAYLL